MDKEYMKELIEDEGINVNNSECYDETCENCAEIEMCYAIASAKCSSEFAESCNYNGYRNEEEFWENL